MLRNLNNFLKHSERILSEMNNSRKDIFNKGIIRNMKYSQMVSNSQKYGNYFLDASLQSHNLPTFEGCEGDLFINAAYLAVYSLHERSLRKFLSELVDIDNELIENTGQAPMLAKDTYRELSHGEHSHVIKFWEDYLLKLYQSRKKNNHNISTLETLFSDLDKDNLEDVAILLVEEFTNFVLNINQSTESQPFRYYLDVVKENSLKNSNVQNSSKLGYHERLIPLSYKLLSIFSADVHRGKEGNGNTGHWITSSKHETLIDSFKKVLKQKYPNRREQIYSIFADYVFAIFSSVYIINYSTIFFEVYNKANQVVIFEGADNLGKSTLIENIIRFNKEKFYSSQSMEKIDGSWEKSEYGTNIDDSVGLDKFNNCTLKFHGYPVDEIFRTEKPKLSYIQYFSKYKQLPSGKNVYARQFANIQNIVTCTMERMESFFASPRDESYLEYENDLGKIVLRHNKQSNHERVLLQDRSVLSTLVYSLNGEKENLTDIIRNYLNYQYYSFNEKELKIIGTEIPIHPDFKLENGNFGPLDFLNVYEDLLNDKTIIANSKLHPGCANFIRSKFVFLESESPFVELSQSLSKETRESITKAIPEVLENVVNQLNNDEKALIEYEEINKQNEDIDYSKLAEDVWEKTGIGDWKSRNKNYKHIYQAYLKNRIHDGKEEYSLRKLHYEESFPNIITENNNKISGLYKDESEVVIPVYEPRNMVRFRKDDVIMYDPKDYTTFELADLVSQTIFN